MPSRSEQILLALFAALSPVGTKVERNKGLALSIPTQAGGSLVVLHDGEPGEPEETFSPHTYHYEHQADVDVFVAGEDTDAAFDALKVAIGTALTADRTLGGLVDWVEPMAPKPGNLPEMGGPPIKAATITVVLHYATTNPLT